MCDKKDSMPDALMNEARWRIVMRMRLIKYLYYAERQTVIQISHGFGSPFSSRRHRLSKSLKIISCTNELEMINNNREIRSCK